MIFLCLLISMKFLIIIDRIEGDFAIIEWENQALSAIPLVLIPCSAQEGDRLHLFVYPTPTGSMPKHPNQLIIATPKGPIAIPIDMTLQQNTKYGIWIQCTKAREN